MKQSKFSEEQVINILREGQSGSTVKAVCAKYNISEPTYYKWQKQYGGMRASEIRQLRALTEENARLKGIVADYAVQIDILKYVNAKSQRRQPQAVSDDPSEAKPNGKPFGQAKGSTRGVS